LTISRQHQQFHGNRVRFHGIAVKLF
jgi:hypothetical protein